ncbi:MAG TPA: hypothetical protein VLM05_06395 [Mycobacteriales bacterium]|nr:hypothetical protein [Mycobacteriales bacterium]
MTDVRQRPRARLNAAHHLAYLALVWVLVLLLSAGAVLVSTGLSGREKLLGALAITAAVAVTTLATVHLCRPVHRPPGTPGRHR